MKTTRNILVAVVAMTVKVCLAWSAPMGTAFTYQGRLIDANNPADGLYDFQFKLYDANIVGAQKGSTLKVDQLDVIDGYFTMALDFGSGVFDGNDRWLEIGVRAGELNDPNKYTILRPRQEVTPTPYALQTRGIFVDTNGNVGIGTTSPVATLDVINAGGHPAISAKSPWIGVYGIHNSTTGTFPGVWGDTDSLLSQSSGVRGKVTSTSPGLLSAGVWGMNAGTGSNGVGVRGSHDGDGYGVYGDTANDGIGVYGLHSASTGNEPGVKGETKSTSMESSGVFGLASATTGITYGVRGLSASNSGYGLVGRATATSGNATGAAGQSDSTSGIGVLGWASNGSGTTYGGYFVAASAVGTGVYGEASNSGDYCNYGGYFEAAGGFGRGVYGWASNSGNVVNYGGFFIADGSSGVAVRGWGKAYDFYAAGPGTDYGSASSIRWKRDIRPIDEALGKVMQLRGVYFNWDAEHGGRHDVGMVAEEVGKVLPEIVEYEENGIDATGMDYGKLTPLLVEAVKALKAENDALKKRIEALEAKM